jgi:hypothetical protein
MSIEVSGKRGVIVEIAEDGDRNHRLAPFRRCFE